VKPLSPGRPPHSVEFHLYDLVEQKHLVGKQYEGALQALRFMVHRMADEVIQQITGEKVSTPQRSPIPVFRQEEGRKSLSPISTERR